MSPIFSLFQTPRISRRVSSPLVCSVSPSSSKCPGVSVPVHSVLESGEGKDSHRREALEKEKGLWEGGSEKERVSGRGEEPIALSPSQGS